MATFVTLWQWPDGVKSCGWRVAPTCAACGSGYEFECTGSCSLVSGRALLPSTFLELPEACCQSVVLSSDVPPWNRRPSSDRLGGYMLVEGALRGGRSVYSHHGYYLSFQNETGDAPGWRVSDDYLNNRQSIIRQSDRLFAPCPTDVTSWEFKWSGMWSDDWLADGSLRIECAQRAPSNSTCVDAPNAGELTAPLLIWLGAAGAAFAARALVLLLARQGRLSVEKLFPVGVALTLASIAVCCVGWQVPDWKHRGWLVLLQFVSALGLVLYLIWLVLHLDDRIASGRLRRKTAILLALAMLSAFGASVMIADYRLDAGLMILSSRWPSFPHSSFSAFALCPRRTQISSGCARLRH